MTRAMRKCFPLLAMFLCAVSAQSQVLRLADLNTREVESLDRAKTVVIIPGGILEEHGPYLPAGADGIFNARMSENLAAAVTRSSSPALAGWKAVVLPAIPLGAGAANEIGRKYTFPGSVTVLPSTLRAIFMDLGDQLGKQGFRWILVVHGHGDPAHNRMLDDAADYFHDTYGGLMLNVFGYVWALDLQDFRTPEERQKDGLAEHASMTETSVIMALSPSSVAPDVRSAPPQAGHSMDDLQRIASAAAWPGYFGTPGLASPELGQKIYDQWLRRAQDLVLRALQGEDTSKWLRLSVKYADDPADLAASSVNRDLEKQHQAWLSKRSSKD